MKSPWTEVERNAYDITAGDEGELRQNKHYNGDHVDSEFARGLETERDALLIALKEAYAGIKEWCDAVDKDSSWDGWDYHFKYWKYDGLPKIEPLI